MRNTDAAALLAAITLLLTGCDPSHRWRPGTADPYGPVFERAASGDVTAVTAALDREPRLIRAREQDRVTLLLEAAGEGQTGVASMLLARGADVNARTGGGLTPLHLAAQNGDLAMLRLLLAHGAKLDQRDRRGMTPLDQAAAHHHPDVAEYLRTRDGRGRQPN